MKTIMPGLSMTDTMLDAALAGLAEHAPHAAVPAEELLDRAR